MYCKDFHIINELSPNYIKDYVGYYCNFKKDESRYTRGIMYIDFDDTPFFPYKSNPTERTILNYFDKKLNDDIILYIHKDDIVKFKQGIIGMNIFHINLNNLKKIRSGFF